MFCFLYSHSFRMSCGRHFGSCCDNMLMHTDTNGKKSPAERARPMLKYNKMAKF